MQILKDYIDLAVLLLEDFVKGSQRKELIIASFVKRLKEKVSLTNFKSTLGSSL